MKKPDRSDLSDAVWTKVYALQVGASLHTRDGQGAALHCAVTALIDQLVSGYSQCDTDRFPSRLPDPQVVSLIVARVDALMDICSAEVDSYADAISEHELDRPILNGGYADGK